MAAAAISILVDLVIGESPGVERLGLPRLKEKKKCQKRNRTTQILLLEPSTSAARGLTLRSAAKSSKSLIGFSLGSIAARFALTHRSPHVIRTSLFDVRFDIPRCRHK